MWARPQQNATNKAMRASAGQTMHYINKRSLSKADPSCWQSRPAATRCVGFMCSLKRGAT